MSEVGGIAVQADMRGAWTGVRDQGARPTCLACVVSDAHAHAHGLDHRLSAEYLFYAGFKRAPLLKVAYGLTLVAAHQALRNDGQPNEVEWPYQPTTPDPWVPPAVTKMWRGGLNSCATGAAGVISSLQAGLPVVLGLRLVPGFNRVQNPPHIIDTSGKPAGGHAVLGVGLGSSVADGGIDLVLIRNSWGFRWGASGCAWLPMDYLSNNLVGAGTIAAVPLAT